MKILVPVDGSKHSDNAIDFIASRATLIGSDPEVELLNVQQAVPPRAARLIGKAALEDYYSDEAGKVLKPAIATLRKAGLQASSSYRIGHAADEIAAVAQKRKDELIVMGSHGHGVIAGLIMGSIARGVLARTRTPMLLLRAKSAPKSDSLKIGIAIDGSKAALQAVKYVLRHGDLFGMKPDITLIHVVPDLAGNVMPDMAGVALPPLTAEELEKQSEGAYEEAVAPARRLFAKAKVAFNEKRLTGPAGDAIADYAAKQKFDVLVMGSHGHGAFRSAVLGSVALRVAAQCKTPLMLVR